LSGESGEDGWAEIRVKARGEKERVILIETVQRREAVEIEVETLTANRCVERCGRGDPD